MLKQKANIMTTEYNDNRNMAQLPPPQATHRIETAFNSFILTTWRLKPKVRVSCLCRTENRMFAMFFLYKSSMVRCKNLSASIWKHTSDLPRNVTIHVKEYWRLWTPLKAISPATVSFRSDWISNVQPQLSLSTDSNICLASFTFPSDICLAI